jgi:hypothetical protein
MKIIYVCIGNFQEYIIDSITNTKKVGNNDIVVLTEQKFFKKFDSVPYVALVDVSELDDHGFNQSSRLDRGFRNGFWYLCSLRLIYVSSYMIKYNVENAMHIENDVIIYHNADTIDKFPRDRVCCVFDCYNRVIPSVIFIPTGQMFKNLTNKFSKTLNDMENLAKFDTTLVERLPIYTINKDSPECEMVTCNYAKYSIIFDGAAIGQFLGGVDPRNRSGDTTGFINETCIIKYNTDKFVWIRDTSGLNKPFININGLDVPIFNLHIHCKNLAKFSS